MEIKKDHLNIIENIFKFSIKDIVDKYPLQNNELYTVYVFKLTSSFVVYFSNNVHMNILLNYDAYLHRGHNDEFKLILLNELV